MFCCFLGRHHRARLLSLPLATSSVAAGFPSPAEDHAEKRLDLNEYLVRNPAATFLWRVKGDSMVGAGIFDGDTLVVDRAAAGEAGDGSIVIAVVEGEYLVKTLRSRHGRVWLESQNPRYQPIPVTDSDAQVWGLVAYTIHRPRAP